MSSRDATAFWIEGPGRAALHTGPLSPPAAGEVTVRALYSGISRGTECLVWRGEVPASEYQRMRAPFQLGDFPGPVKYGYSNVGIVEEGDAALRGHTVFCLYPHQDVYRVPAQAVHPLPAGLPPARAVLAANLETAINGLWDAAPRLGDRVAVVGAGVVGMLVAALVAGLHGCTIELVDVDRSRDPVARRLGVDCVAPEAARPDADVVIHASGSPAGLVTALSLAGFEATVVEMSWYGSRTVAAPLGEAFHSRRLMLKSSQVATIAPAQRARWTATRRLALALALLREERFDALFTGEHDFATLPSLFARLATAPAGVLCERIRYP